jgi:dTDP-4-dehydrorhamnose reductase
MKNKILITGGSGQLGANLYKIIKNDFHILKPTSKEVNFLFPKNIKNYLIKNKPDFIVNCAAYTNVDQAENDKENCLTINVESVESIAEFSEKNNIPFIHLSTDYVFGSKNNKIPWKENDNTDPLNFYGLTKLMSEKIIVNNSSMGLIIRTSGLYSNENNNFLNTMINLVINNKNIKVVGDQINSPTPAWWLAYALKHIINLKIANRINKKIKILHAASDGKVSWYDFTLEIFKCLKKFNLYSQPIQLLEISSENYKTKAVRPLFSALDISLIKSLGINTIHWKDGISKTLLNRKMLIIDK